MASQLRGGVSVRVIRYEPNPRGLPRVFDRSPLNQFAFQIRGVAQGQR
jgi:hypothetical protein